MAGGKSGPAVAVLAGVAISTSGCALAIRTTFPQAETPERIAVAYTPAPDGLRVLVANLGRPNQLLGVGYGDLIGAGLDVLVGINLPLFAGTFGDAFSAYVTSGVLTAALLVGEFAPPGVWTRLFAAPKLAWTLRVGSGSPRPAA